MAVATDGVLFGDLLDGRYDCVDRIVLRAYCQLCQRAAGFRTWWRRWQGSDENLNNTHLMRVAGRFARRVKAWADREEYRSCTERLENAMMSWSKAASPPTLPSKASS